MARPIYSLGIFDFISFNAFGQPGGMPPVAKRSMAVQERPNVRGTAIQRFQPVGRPFYARSFVDLANDAQMAILFGNYHLAVGADPLPLIWRDLNYFTLYSHLFVILDVEQCVSKWMTVGVGGLNPPSLSSLSAIWTLQPVEIFQVPPQT